MKSIPLFTKAGRISTFAIVDDEDWEFLSVWTWRLHSSGYACRYEPKKTILMHREILGRHGELMKEGTDHRNRKRLDNQKHNLRCASHAQNMQNRKVHKHSKTGVRGVWKRGASWQAQVFRDKERKFRKCFRSFCDAVNAVRIAREGILPYAID